MMRHSILFTGHMIDKEGRSSPRFPPDKEKSVRKEIEKQIQKLREDFDNILIGIAGGACGGDIIFHELCLEMNIPSEMYLALRADEFKEQSVSFANKAWDKRFDRLVQMLPVHILPESSTEERDQVWERANLWMLQNALQNGGENLTLIAVWDRKGGDGSGGTEHMVEVANDQNAKVKIIDINTLQA